jgi:sugar lactone lactonase YvrE
MALSRLTGGVAVGLCGFVVACGSHTAPRSGIIFWAQSPHGGEDERGSIGRADLIGSGADGRFIVGAKAPGGIAVSGRYVYWANYASGTIARARLDGSDVGQRFVKAGDEYSIVGIAVDGEHIYWASSGLDPNSGTIGRANLDGSGVNERFIKAGDSPVGLAVDGHHIYWTHRFWGQRRVGVFFNYAIGRADLDGSHIDLRFIDASNVLDAVAAGDRYVFWSNVGEHAIGRSNIDGTDVSQRCITLKTPPLENVPEGLAVDGQDVYWTNYPADTIGRAHFDGSDINEHFVAVKGVPAGIAVAPTGAAAASSSSGGRCARSKRPLLLGPTGQSAGPYAEGWGEVAPAVISNGGAAASGTVSQIHWSSWGGTVAIGRGLHPEYTPHGGYYPKPLVMELRASAIRRCKPSGRFVYSRFSVREQVKPGGPMAKKWLAWASNMCAGFR